VYNHRNEVIEKNLGKNPSGSALPYLQSVDYTYNFQGWLTGINELFTGTLPMGPDPCGGGGVSSRFLNENMNPSTLDEMDIFAQKLNYDVCLSNNKNGNISHYIICTEHAYYISFYFSRVPSRKCTNFFMAIAL
jgi:hypothetical protein